MTLPHPRILSLCEGGFSDWGLMHLDNVGLTQDWPAGIAPDKEGGENYYLNKNSLESLQTQISKEYALSSVWGRGVSHPFALRLPVLKCLLKPQMVQNIPMEHTREPARHTGSEQGVGACSLTLLLLFHWFS